MSKEILIFDMDGVLLKPLGYHQALKETVRLGARELGFENISISDAEIAEFEGLGISSEWHSSAACMASLVVYGKINLKALYNALKREQVQYPARIRLERAVQHIAKAESVDHVPAASIIRESQSIELSSTFNIFQELILGSEDFTRIYEKKGCLGVKSYLLQFDQPLLGTDMKNRLFIWLEDHEHRCVVMTNRPSSSIPDAEYGLRLVNLENIPLVGSTDIEWLGNQINVETSELLKPSPVHALAAVFAAYGKNLKDSLLDASAVEKGNGCEDITHLNGSRIWIFEDTSAGLISVEKMEKLLHNQSVTVQINKIGIASTPVKGEYLKEQGARIFENIDTALKEIL